MADWLDDLNPQQRSAVTHGTGPLLVVAGAGSGKTKTLAYRVAWLIAQGTDPGRILLLTFTRRAAEEMIKRAEAVMRRGGTAVGQVWGGTFHATANRLLRVYARGAGIDPDFTVMDHADAEDLLNVVRHELGLAVKEVRFPRKSTCLDIYSRCVNGAETLAEVLERFFPWCVDHEADLRRLFKAYVEHKHERNVLDYDDLLLYWDRLLDDETIARDMGERFDHILVDEYQDTNPVQARILKGMRRYGGALMAVGDDAQSIYSFRAATVRNMLDFPRQFPDTTVVTLDQNYRSVMSILEATNRLISPSRERYSKNLWTTRPAGQRPQLVTCRDEAQQDEFVVRTVLQHYEQGIPLRKQAVLVRASHHADSLELELTRRNIPYHKYGGLRFLEAAHVKDLVAYLRIAENPRDEMAWYRVLQLIEGVGPATAARAVRYVHQHQDDARAIGHFVSSAASAAGLQGLGALLADLLSLGRKAPAVAVERIRSYYAPILQARYDNPVVRGRDLEQLERIAAGYASLRGFLTDLTLDPPSATGDYAGPPVKDEDWLTLSTIHSAKGCEWDVVLLIHAADGNLPADMATGSPAEIEEELRLTYVAMTRARDFLYVARPLRYYSKWHSFTDRHTYAQLCRFITADVRAAMEEVTLPQTEARDVSSDRITRSDVRARLRAMWE